MDIKGLWTLVSAKGLNAETFEQEWFTNEQLNALPDDNFLKMMANTMVTIEDDSLKICNPVKIPEDTPQEEIDEFLKSGEGELVDGKLMMSKKLAIKFEDGKLLVDSGERGTVFDEPINPWKPIEELGNTLIILDQYQIVRSGETPSEIKKTVKEEKQVSAETAAAAGTYIGKYTKFVGDPDTAKKEEPFKLVLNADGTGKSFRDELEIKVPDWSVEGGSFKLTEKFLGTIDYTGTLSGSSLTLYNGDPSNALTCTYVYEKE